MMILKVTKNQGFTLSLEDAFFEKFQGGQIDPTYTIHITFICSFRFSANFIGTISITLKPKNFGRAKFRIFFCPNINPSEIISCRNFSKIQFFFLAVTQMKIYIEDQSLWGNVGKKNNTVEMMYLFCI